MQNEALECKKNQIHKKCFFAFFVCVFLNFMLKVNLWNLVSNTMKNILLWVMEPLPIVLVLYFDLFIHAKNGMMPVGQIEDWHHFPCVQYAKWSVGLSVIFTISLWSLRMLVAGPGELYGFPFLAMTLLLYATTWVFCSIVIYSSFYVAFLIARKF